MVSVKTKQVRGKDYFYLRYSYRDNDNIKLIEKGIGTEIPEDIDDIKIEFIKQIFQKRWKQSIEFINNKYRKKFESLPTPIQVKHLKNFGIRFTYHSNKIEGSTLTHREVALIIEEPNVPINKPPNEIIEARVHNQIYEAIIKSKEHKELSMEMVQEWHKNLFNLHPLGDDFAGFIRKEQVYISGSDHVPPPPQLVKPLLNGLFDWYNENKDSIHSVLLACLMHFTFVSIHPFRDGNGRMCRLIMNYILYNNNYPMYDLPYNIRKSYYRALEKSNVKDDKMHFVGWFMRNYIKYIKSLQL